MKKIIPNGTEVLIFKYKHQYDLEHHDKPFIIGIIQSSKSFNDLYHESAYDGQIYEVLGEDGNKYFGTYGYGLIGNSFFRTKEDYIKILENKIECNDKNILKFQNENARYYNQINLLKSKTKTKS